MKKDLGKKAMDWADQYRVVLGNKGVSNKYAPWYMRRAEEFMRYAGYTDPQGLTREVVERYLAELGRQNRLEDWQFRQVVDAMRMLVLDLAGHDWAKAICLLSSTPVKDSDVNCEP